MAKMLVDLKGRDCMIKFEELPMGIASNRVKCNIIDVDEEWIKFTVTNKKGEKVTKITRLEKISEVEIDG